MGLLKSQSGETTRGAIACESEKVLGQAQQIISAERDALDQVVNSLDQSFVDAAEIILNCTGKVVFSGIGKAGIISQKLAASFSSTGTPSYFLHPAEALHGDLGCVQSQDIAIVLSNSGETEEIVRLLTPLKLQVKKLIAITARESSKLGKSADVTINMGSHREAGELALAPSTTTTAMLALGDALGLIVSQQRQFTREQFATFHPAGNLGRQLTDVCEVMRPLEECRVASADLTLREVIVSVSRPGRRTGAVMLLDSQRKLVGLFTDSDLARLLERSEEARLDQPVSTLMTRRFTTASAGDLLSDAMQQMAERKISELPIVDSSGCAVGMIDVTDIVDVVANPGSGRDAKTEESHPRILSLKAS